MAPVKWLTLVSALGFTALALSGNKAAAQNPWAHAYAIPVRVTPPGQKQMVNIKSGQARFGPNMPNKGNGAWVPGLKPWNGRNTSKGNPIWNNDTTGIKFPVNVVVRVRGGFLIVNAQAADSDSFWDWYYITQGQDDYVNRWGLPKGTFTRLSGSSFDQNCYGYASGLGYVTSRDTPGVVKGAQPAPNGMMLFFKDEGWAKANTTCTANCILMFTAAPLSDHCVVLKDCCPKGCKGADTVKTTREKNAVGGVYEGTWDCPPGINLAPKGDIWCKP